MIDLPDTALKDPTRLGEYLEKLKRKKEENMRTFCSSEFSKKVQNDIDEKYAREITEVEEQLKTLDYAEFVGV